MYEGRIGGDFVPVSDLLARQGAAVLGPRQTGMIEKAPSPPTSPVFQAIGATEQELAALFDRLDLLEHRLSTVLLPTPPSPATTGQGTAPGRAVSETTERVARIGIGIQSARDRMQSLIERLEV